MQLLNKLLYELFWKFLFKTDMYSELLGRGLYRSWWMNHCSLLQLFVIHIHTVYLCLKASLERRER